MDMLEEIRPAFEADGKKMLAREVREVLDRFNIFGTYTDKEYSEALADISEIISGWE